MALFDFLFGGGTAAPDVTTSGISTTEIPEYIAKPSAQLIGAAADVASEEYVPYKGPRLAGLSPEEEAAIKQQRDMAGTGYNEASFGIGKLVGASDFLKSKTDPSTLSFAKAATGYGEDAAKALREGKAGISGADISKYMSSYMMDALDPAARKLREESERQTMADSAKSIQAGAFGGSREAVLRGERGAALTEGIGDLYAKGLQSSYESALKAAQDDRKRSLQAGQQFGALTGQMGNLAKGMTSAADAERNIGLGTISGAATKQQLGSADVASQLGVGALERGMDQKAQDIAYSEYLKKQYYPKEQLTFMSGILQGAPYPVQTYTQGTSPGQSQPSGFSQLLGLGMQAAGTAAGLGWTPFA